MWIFDKLEEFFKNLLIELITGNLDRMFGDVNQKVGTIAGEVALSPLNWNSDIYGLIRDVSDAVVVPIAGLIIAYVLCYELITLILEKNNLREFETFIFFKFVIKAFIAVFFVSHTMDIAMAIFDVSSYAIENASSVISGASEINITDSIAAMIVELQTMSVGKLVVLAIQTFILSWVMTAMSIIITVILYGRMLEIYLYISVASIPFATMTNKEWGTMGTSYLRGLFALGFQGFFIIICVGAYTIIINNFAGGGNFNDTLLSMIATSVVLCVMLMKSGSIAKTIFNAH